MRWTRAAAWRLPQHQVREVRLGHLQRQPALVQTIALPTQAQHTTSKADTSLSPWHSQSELDIPRHVIIVIPSCKIPIQQPMIIFVESCVWSCLPIKVPKNNGIIYTYVFPHSPMMCSTGILIILLQRPGQCSIWFAFCVLASQQLLHFILFFILPYVWLLENVLSH